MFRRYFVIEHRPAEAINSEEQAPEEGSALFRPRVTGIANGGSAARSRFLQRGPRGRVTYLRDGR